MANSARLNVFLKRQNDPRLIPFCHCFKDRNTKLSTTFAASPSGSSEVFILPACRQWRRQLHTNPLLDLFFRKQVYVLQLQRHVEIRRNRPL